MHGSTVNPGAAASLILNRIVYAVNWFSLAAVFSLIASEFNQNISGLGLATAAFYVSIGIFQVPGGILAASIGPRLTAICGTIVASLSVLLTGFAHSLVEIVVLRFFVGLGMAFVFSPGVILITRFLRKGSQGLGVGLYNSAFYIGSAAGLSGWSIFASLVGWRASLIAGGLLGLFTSVLILISVPKDTWHSNFKVDFLQLKRVLSNKWLITLSVTLLGLGVGNTVVGNFMPYYLEDAIHISAGEAGTIASTTSLSALATAPFWGKLFDKVSDAKQLLLASGVLMAIGVGIASLGTIYSAVLSGVLVGLAAGSGYTFGYSAVRVAKGIDREYETLAVSWVNSISLLGNFVPPLCFSYMVIQCGYSFSWLFLAVLTSAFMIPLLLVCAVPSSPYRE
jgi:MFS family permease